MAHGIFADRAAFIGEKTERNVWHVQGKYTGIDKNGQPKPFKSIDAAAEMGRIIFNVFKEPNFNRWGVELPNQFNLYRDRFNDDPVPSDLRGKSLEELHDILGPVLLTENRTVTTRYNVYQTKLAVDALRPLVEAGLLSVTACGVLNNGQKIWISAEINTGKTDAVIRTNPDGSPDTVKRHVMFLVAHDGFTANELNVSDIRVVCANTARMAREQGVTFFLKHSRKDGELAYKKAQDGLAKMSKDFAGVIEQFKFLNSVKVLSAEVEVFLKALFPVPEGKDDFGAKRAKQTSQIVSLFEGEGKGLGGGTWWDLYNAVTEQIDWYPANGNPNTPEHAESIWFGSKATVRDNALALVTGMAQKKAPALVTA